ncbi:MAG: Asp-tRNA(Asn)/Glu-tRNA(Gln) amidotransferase subunit GatC, partial [Desulfobulbaceae bacterium]|nr:Asp-tRNA(Asn)/Glu-tRNA(Gln) amidotransferase subunit GatC [Desulfobulbaceae bacterium]
MKITPQEISHVADLARLHMSREELEAMALQLDDILNYVAKLNELDTESVTPTTHAISITNAFREDVVKPSLSRDK